MAIEIDEMVVKARTGPGSGSDLSGSAGTYPDLAGKEVSRKAASQKVQESEREREMLKKQLLLECREMILEIIQDRMER
ncbi:MAG: hypothetical protein KKC20_00520 [Proteobacteria bacterium]|nr:hypothetical protein [Pseudomonadota bacterium]